MKSSYRLGLIILVFIALVAGVLALLKNPSNNQSNMLNNTLSKTLRLTSTAFEPNGLIPKKYTCDGSNFSPPLTISGVPPGAKSLALIMDDPDAPAGVWDHWIVYNLPAETRELGEGDPPPGTLGLGTAQNSNYDGPCPPSGVHRYFFKLYALDTELFLPPGATKTEVEQAMKEHIIDQAELIGRYGRQ